MELEKKVAGLGNVDTAIMREILDMRLEELSEGRLAINEESGRDKDEEDVPEKVTSAKKKKNWR